MNKAKLIALLTAVSMAAVVMGCSGEENQEVTEEVSTVAESDEELEAGAPPSDMPEEEVEAVPEVLDDDILEGVELMDYMGKSSDELTAAFPSLESSENQFWDTEELMADGLEMAGPFFDVDSSLVVTGITYGGTKYTLMGIYAGMPMQLAADVVKADGWEFSSVEIAHGTCQYVATYVKDGKTIALISDTEGEFGEDQESDVKGNVAKISVY